MRAGSAPEETLKRLEEGFVLGGHKAAAIASVLQQGSIYLVSSLPKVAVRETGLIRFADVDEAVEAAYREAGREASLIVMPQGGAVLPALKASLS